MVSRHHQRIIDTALAVSEQPDPDQSDRAFLTRYLVQVTLPHANPGDVPAWTRTNGKVRLTIRPAWDSKTGKAIGYPYGTVPRLLLFWLTREVLHKKARRIELGRSLAEFMRALGLNPDTGGGVRGDAHRLRDQMERLFRSVLSLDVEDGNRQSWLDMQVAPKGEFWWDFKTPDQSGLFGSWIELGESFFEAIMASPVPVDMRVLRALKRSPLALDLYAWATYKTFSVNRKGQEQMVPWEGLSRQLGGDYASIRDFRKAVRDAIRKITAASAGGLRITEQIGDESGLVIWPGTTSVRPRAVTG